MRFLPTVLVSFVLILSQSSFAQHQHQNLSESESESKSEPNRLPDKDLAFGAPFIDRFKPLPEMGDLHSDTWGTDEVKPRYTDNGLDSDQYSYWGGNIHVDEKGTHHLFACRWLESHPQGHNAWPRSEIIHSVSTHRSGPYRVVDVVGEGHNPELHQLKNGKYFLYTSKRFTEKYYFADSLNGPWELKSLSFDPRQRPIIDHMANDTFAMRDDGSMVMVSRGGGIWISQTGLTPYQQVTSQSVYPPFDGRYEDPVVWKTNIQYHLVVNDWMGRQAYHMRSKDGIKWKLDPGVAYLPGIARHQDGRLENWFKFERMKVLQDEKGRAIQANFAVCDVPKKNDLSSDDHSSKNICIPLTVGRLVEFVDRNKVTEQTEQIRLKIRAEPGFDPHRDIDVASLRLGAPEEVDFGRGCAVESTKRQGDDLLVTFFGQGNGFTDDNFAAKLLGRTSGGDLLFGYARLPWVDYSPAHLSCVYPELTIHSRKTLAQVRIDNFGVAASKEAKISIDVKRNGQWISFAKKRFGVLQPHQHIDVVLNGPKLGESGQVVQVRVRLLNGNIENEVLDGPVLLR